jgi:hypothetical protein
VQRVRDSLTAAAWALAPFVLIAIVWEAVFYAGVFPPKLFP